MGVFGWVSGALFLGMQAWAFPSPESGKNNKKQADYLDPHSGIMLPGQVQLFKQSYLKKYYYIYICIYLECTKKQYKIKQATQRLI